MFIVERLFGVGVYAILLILACALIARRGSKYKRILFIYTIALAMMGFFYVPYVTADIYRIYEFLDYFQTMDLPYFVKRYENSSTFVAYLYYFLFAKIGEFRLLPAVTAFICYSCIFYIFRKTMEKYDISRKNLAIALFFYMAIGNYMFVISGIRTMLALSLIFFCFFRETIEKKFKWYHIPLYFLAAFIHNFAVVIILIRLLIPLFDRTVKLEKKFVYIGFLVILAIFMAFNMSDLLDAVWGRAEGYITNDRMYSYVWEYLIGAIVILISLIALLKVKTKYFGNGETTQFKTFSLISLLFAIILYFEFTIFHRLTTYASAITVTPVVMLYLDKYASKNKRMFILTLSIAMFVIACARGSICSLKFFEL